MVHNNKNNAPLKLKVISPTGLLFSQASVIFCDFVICFTLPFLEEAESNVNEFADNASEDVAVKGAKDVAKIRSEFYPVDRP